MTRLLGERAALVRLLQRAYSGERGAAFGYAGHAASLRQADQRSAVERIRLEELDHRTRVGRLLAGLGARPDPWLEVRNRLVGQAVAAFCHVGGWFLPMYGAGWIERRNIAEYERAARLAARCGHLAAADELLALAEIEWQHERYFRQQAVSHWAARLLPIWQPPAGQSEIRLSFARCLTEPPRAGDTGHHEPGKLTRAPRPDQRAVGVMAAR